SLCDRQCTCPGSSGLPCRNAPKCPSSSQRNRLLSLGFVVKFTRRRIRASSARVPPGDEANSCADRRPLESQPATSNGDRFVATGGTMRRSRWLFLGAAMMVVRVLHPTGGEAASHREAPLIAQDPTADNTDFYMFRSWEDPSKVVFIVNVIPG